MVKRKSFWLIALALIVLVGAAKILQPSAYHPDRTPKMNNIPPKIEALFKTTRPVCFGRFMIDVPEKAEVIWGVASIPYDFRVYPNQGYMIKAEIKAKIDKITSEKHQKEPSMLVEVVDSVNEDSKIVVGYENVFDKNILQFHSYIRLDKTAFVQSIPRAVVNNEERKTIILEKLLSIAQRLRLRSETEIPEEQGICVEEGFISSPLDYYHEVIQVGFRFPEYPDVTFSIETYSMDKPSRDDTLAAALARGEADASRAGQSSLFSRIKQLRMGDRVIGQWEGAEGLLHLPSGGREPETHEFLFKTPGVGMDLLRPAVTLKLYTGVVENTRAAVQPSLTDDEAIAMWDKLTSTIRVRPVKENPSDGKPKPENTPPAPEHGAKAPKDFPRKLATGETCPKTGPWRCVEDGNTHNFAEGQRMPAAYFYKPATGLLNRIKGVKEVFSHTGPGHWEWVGEVPGADRKRG